MDLKSFARKKGRGRPQEAPIDESKISKEQRAAAEDIMAQAKQYEGMEEDQLMGELMKNVAQGRQDGSFSEEKLDEFITKVSPMLTQEQRKRLEEIRGKLRD